MRVIVTRPQREAQDWVARLREAGWQAEALPLIDIRLAPESDALHQAWQTLAAYRAVMFVSANAVDGFFAARPEGMTGWPTRAWATGPGTVAALQRAGLAPAQIDAPVADAPQFDSEALWRVVADRVEAGDRVLIVRGGDADQAQAFEGVGRDWLAQRLREAGARAEFAVSYQRVRPVFDARQQALAAEAAGDGSVWLFSSSEAVVHLRASLPRQDWSAARAVATHARIAAAARTAGFAHVLESRPSLPDVMASIESLQ